MFLISQSFWEARATKEKGRGIFAKAEIAAGTVIGDYLGKIIRPEDDDLTVVYGMWRNDEETIVPEDRNSIGIHLLNNSCSPNCWMYPFEGHTLFIAIRHIFPGEELTIAYLIDTPEDGEICHEACYCKSIVCRGTMHVSTEVSNRWENYVTKKHGKYLNQKIVSYGQVLPRLASYPENINDDPIFDLFGALDKSPEIVQGSSLPDILQIRSMIRQSGRKLFFQNLGIYILGVTNNMLVISIK